MTDDTSIETSEAEARPYVAPAAAPSLGASDAQALVARHADTLHRISLNAFGDAEAALKAGIEALRAQAAGVAPVNHALPSVLLGFAHYQDVERLGTSKEWSWSSFAISRIKKQGDEAVPIYAGAPTAHVPADVEARFEALWSGLSDENRKLVAEYAMHHMPPHPTPEPVQAVDAVDEREAFEAWKKTMQDGFNEFDAWQGRAALAARQPQAQQGGGEVLTGEDR